MDTEPAVYSTTVAVLSSDAQANQDGLKKTKKLLTFHIKDSKGKGKGAGL